MTPGSTIKFLSFSCPHKPLTDKGAEDWLLGEISNRQPDLIVGLGDWHEASSASRWPNEYDWDLAYEFEEVNKFLAQIRMEAPNAKRVFLHGNHDANILGINRIDRKLRSLCDFRDHEPELSWWEQPGEYVNDRLIGSYSAGQITFIHGFSGWGPNPDETQACMFGQWNGLVVAGHTHRPIPVTQAKKGRAPLRIWYANPGCLRDLKPDFVKQRDTHAWGHAIVAGEVKLVKSPRLSPAWNAETVVYQMASDMQPFLGMPRRMVGG